MDFIKPYAYAQNTLKTRRSQLKRYQDFCDRLSLPALPVTPQTACRFLVDIGESLTFSTLNNCVSALNALGKFYDSTFDTLAVDGISYNHSMIHKLPNGLNLEMAFTREYDDQIFFNSEHVFLSNLHLCQIELADATCTSLEEAYFYLMAKDVRDLKLAQQILTTHLPREIKHLEGTIVATKEWLNKAGQVMYDLLVLKFKQNPHLQTKLLVTGNKSLIESTRNKYWGGDKQFNQVLHACFVNTKGHPDLQMEWVAKQNKRHIKHMYSNKSMKNIHTESSAFPCLY